MIAQMAMAASLNDEVRRLRAQNEQLRAALKECADDLEAELKGHYGPTLDYPSQRARFDRDMTSVVEARKLLGDEQTADQESR